MANDMTTVVTTFDDEKIADKAIDALRKEGFKDGEIQILSGNADKLVRELSGRGFGEADARGFADAAGRGKTLVAARVTEAKADQAASILERYEASREDEGRDTGQTVPIVEESLSVSAGKVATGGVRVTSSVAETPVEQKVTLREEQVGAERRSTDRALSADEAATAFEEKTVEIMGTKEEAVVQKEARVVGEVELTRETTEREQTVRGTVRKTDVAVEEVGSTSRTSKK